MAFEFVNFAALGFLGACAYVIMWSKSFADLKSYSNFRHIVIGAIVGFVYTFLHSDYNFPNFIMTFVVGYMGPDFVEALVDRFKPKPPT